MNTNKCLIYEVYKGDSFNLKLNESQVGVPEGMMRVTGVAAVIGVKNRNNRIYNKENYLHHIQLLQEDIAYGLLGELEHPQEFTINLNNVSHKIEAVWYEPSTNSVMITLLLLDTPKGKIAQSIIKAGLPLRVSSRAMGSVNANHEAIISKLVTYDIVGTPGFRETELRLSESVKNAVPIHETSLCESFYVLATQETLNECMKCTYDGDIKDILNNHIINENMNSNKSKNLALLNEALAGGGAPSSSSMPSKISEAIQRWFIGTVAPVFESWVVEEALPLYEEYNSKKAINESLGKSSCSFSAYYRMNAAEAIRKMNEALQPLNGTIVLSEEEQQVLDKVQQGQQLTEEEKQIAQQAQQKLQQQQQQIAEALNPLNGTIVLSQEEEEVLQQLQQGQQLTQEQQQIAQQALVKQQQQIAQQQQIQEGQQQQGQKLTQQEQQVIQKCMQGQQLTQQEQKVCQQAQQKLQQQLKQQQQMSEGQQQGQLTQEEQHCMQKFMQGQQLTQRQQQIVQQAQQKLQQQQQKLQQQQQQGQKSISQQQQELKESLNEKNIALTQAYRRLLEAEQQSEQEKVNQEIDELKQECDELKQQIDQLAEQQSPKFQACQQKIQQGEELTQDDLDGLTQDEIQDLIQQQQANESAGDYDDPNDAKVFEQAQLTQQEQQVVKKNQQGQQLTQQEQQILKQAQEKMQQQQLPENDDQVNESLVAKYGASVLGRSTSLLESLQKRMGMALDGKN